MRAGQTLPKPLRSRWVPSHRDVAKAKTKEEQTGIKRNDEVDRWAKMATGLPLPEYTPTHPGDHLASNHLVWYRTGLRCSAASKTPNNVVMTMRL